MVSRFCRLIQFRADDFDDLRGYFFEMLAQIFRVARFRDFEERVIKDFDAAEFGAFHGLRPDAVRAFDRDGQDRHAGFERDPRRAGLEFEQFAVGKRPRAFGEDQKRRAVLERAVRFAQHAFRRAALRIDRERAEIFDQPADQKPFESLIPSHKTKLAADRRANPERIEIGLVIGDDEQTAGEIFRNVFLAVILDAPENFARRIRDIARRIDDKGRRIFVRGRVFFQGHLTKTNSIRAKEI
jgi:hypothetical protein